MPTPCPTKHFRRKKIYWKKIYLCFSYIERNIFGRRPKQFRQVCRKCMLIVRENILGEVVLKKFNFVFLDFKQNIFGLSEKIIGTVFKSAFSVSEETSPAENILLQKTILLVFRLRAKNFRALTDTISTGLSKAHANCARELFGRCYFDKV